VYVTITPQPFTSDTVFFTILADGSATACGMTPATIVDPVVTLLGGSGLSGNSGAFGNYTIDPVTGCITFNANDLTGFGIDTICVSLCDTVSGNCHITCYLPAILPDNGCPDIVSADSLFLVTTNCAAGASTCVDIPFIEIVQYDIKVDGNNYTAGYLGCDEDTLIVYTYSNMPGQLDATFGPYNLTSWTVNGATFNGAFADLNGLLDLMNAADPSGNWTLQLGTSNIVGGNPSNTYGSIEVMQNGTGAMGISNINTQLRPKGTDLRFDVGFHEVIFKNIQTGCSDTLYVDVECIVCPPIHDNPPTDPFGNIEWMASDCAADTVFCTNILATNLANYVVTDNGDLFNDFVVCDVDSTICYNYFTLPGMGQSGPYTITGWVINGATQPGTTVADVAGIVAYMNSVDASGWALDPLTTCITGGSLDSLYGSMFISQGGQALQPLEASFLQNGTKLGFKLDTGFHLIQVVDTFTTCSYDIFFKLLCPNVDVVDTIVFTIPEGGDTTICLDTTYLTGTISSWANACPNNGGNNVNYQVNTNTWCIDFFGMSPGLDTFCIELCDDLGDCVIQNVLVTVTPVLDTIELTVNVGTVDTLCFNNTGLGTVSIDNFCANSSGNAIFFDILPGTDCITYDAAALGSDTACVVYCWDDNGTIICDSTIVIINSVQNSDDTLFYTLAIGEEATWCVDPTQFPGAVTIVNNCPSTSTNPNAFISLDPGALCLDMVGNFPGMDTACLTICSGNYCQNVTIFISVTNQVINLTTIAMADDTITFVNTPVFIPGIENDTILGQLNNTAGLASVTIIAPPTRGTVSFDPTLNLFNYAPFQDECGGFDQFVYLVTDSRGRTDTALVRIQIFCEVIVHNGISPNGDGMNEALTIDGIQYFPNNKLTIFNRWGNMVYDEEGYGQPGVAPWGGTWNDKDLPDGTYFYVLDLGNNEPPLSGYIQILR